MNNFAYTPIPSFKFWCQKVLPLVYDDSLSYYEVLCKLTEYINLIIDNQDYFKSQLDEFGLTIEQLQKDIDYLMHELDKVKNGDYTSMYLDALKNYLDENLQKLVAGIVKYIVFGLSMDGHFVAYIPPSWDFITFDTIMQPGELYGHLVLNW